MCNCSTSGFNVSIASIASIASIVSMASIAFLSFFIKKTLYFCLLYYLFFVILTVKYNFTTNESLY